MHSFLDQLLLCALLLLSFCVLSYPVLWCVKTRVCSMVSDPLSQLTAVFVPSGNDPPSTHCGSLCVLRSQDKCWGACSYPLSQGVPPHTLYFMDNAQVSSVPYYIVLLGTMHTGFHLVGGGAGVNLSPQIMTSSH